MARPLELSYNWRTPVFISTVGLVVCVGIVANSGVLGWMSVAVSLFAMWAAFMVVVWLRTRAYMGFDGPLLTVRRYRHFSTVDGRTVTAVKEFLTPNGPCYRLFTAADGGSVRRHYVPAALLRTGHSTLFQWLLTWAPRASLDRGSLRTIDTLRTRGLLE
ncbi:MAG: hypothetical protein AVDCRST_MAG75-564 [uncultured Propionibacteriaceae bacterium]|uniref:Uncharacterized protein n=1 Tax=uncultured Propionibacteriaceae bacterium TaxID=257457 RepID=A0A6J4N300_9ACTN|nr:MAG: hypothetical protein AVDCRST_MAG75-564 [uncultured Propionibacteriaceae bacterium]